MPTEVVRGTATSVRYTIDVRGGRDGVSTSHHAIFKVGETTVLFTSGSPPIIGDGDQIVVAGRRRGKVLLAEAYVNRTAMIRGNSGLWQNLLGAAFTLSAGGVGLALVLPPFNLEPELMVMGAGLVFIGMGLLLLYRGVVILRAVRLVKEG